MERAQDSPDTSQAGEAPSTKQLRVDTSTDVAAPIKSHHPISEFSVRSECEAASSERARDVVVACCWHLTRHTCVHDTVHRHTYSSVSCLNAQNALVICGITQLRSACGWRLNKPTCPDGRALLLMCSSWLTWSQDPDFAALSDTCLGLHSRKRRGTAGVCCPLWPRRSLIQEPVRTENECSFNKTPVHQLRHPYSVLCL